jgi:hypothetical protein
VTLRAVDDLVAFSFAGREIAPVLHGRPGSILIRCSGSTNVKRNSVCLDRRGYARNGFDRTKHAFLHGREQST